MPVTVVKNNANFGAVPDVTIIHGVFAVLKVKDDRFQLFDERKLFIVHFSPFGYKKTALLVRSG